jgi:hypothetical protein
VRHLVALAALALVSGCASHVTVLSEHCLVDMELRTGEQVVCTDAETRIERASVRETIQAAGGLLGGALRVMLGGP